MVKGNTNVKAATGEGGGCHRVGLPSRSSLYISNSHAFKPGQVKGVSALWPRAFGIRQAFGIRFIKLLTPGGWSQESPQSH